MNGDTFSRIEAWMVQFHRSKGRDASREFASGFANIVSSRLANRVMSESQSALLSQLRESHSVEDISRALRSSSMSMTDMLAVCIYAQRETGITVAEFTQAIEDLRAAQRSEEPTGAHPYRSAPSIATAGHGSPVAASSASERVAGRPESDHPANGQRSGLAWAVVLFAGFAVIGYGAWTQNHVVGVSAILATFVVAIFAAFHLPEHAR